MFHRQLISLVFINLVWSPIIGQKIREYTQSLQYLEKHQVTAQVVGPGVQYEAGILDPVSFSSSFSPGISNHTAGNNISYAWHNRIRFYVNLRYRDNQKKNISGNSGNYLALANSVFLGNMQITGNLEAPEDFTMVFNGGLYGLQRTSRRGFNFNTELGVGYYQGRGIEDGLGIILNLSFGWVLTQRR